MLGQRLPLLRPFAGSALWSTLLGLAGISSVHANVVNFSVDGLPSGLQVVVSGEFVVCANGVVGSRSAGGVQLTENSYTSFDRVTLPSGVDIFTTTVHYFYTGTLQPTPPSNNGCGQTPNESFRYEYTVVGANAAGAIRTRAMGSGGFVLGASVVNIKDTLSAQTTRLSKRNGSSTSLQLGFQDTLLATYQSSAGGTAVRVPTLDITRQVNYNGMVLNVSVAKAVINTSDQVCVTSGGQTACRARSSGGTVTAGVLSVNISAMSNKTSGKNREVEWPIKIDPSLGTGSFGFVAKADDFDSILYFVNGDATDLDLLPWKGLRVPFELVN
jgi:hypothetical protein